MSPVLQLFQHRLADGESVALGAAPRVIYSVDRNEAWFSADAVVLSFDRGGHLLRWEIGDEPQPESQISATLRLNGEESYLVRCDRVELPPGGTAYLHTHRGPGIRCLVEGRFRVQSNGLHQTVERYGAWFANGTDPVEAQAVSEDTAAFVRVMVLPRELLGRPSIRYVRENDKDRPKPQRYQVFVDEPLDI
jgi:quercetin dioxygenase-like cupin family protein